MKYFLLLLLLPFNTYAQKAVEWKDLEDVEFEEFYDRDRSEWSMKAEFGDEVALLDGVEIEITGYVIPLDVSGEVYVLSAFAFSSCFFCGGAGPESVIGMDFKESPERLATDEVIQVRGTLRMNVNPGLEFHYMLDDVTLIQKY